LKLEGDANEQARGSYLQQEKENRRKNSSPDQSISQDHALTFSL